MKPLHTALAPNLERDDVCLAWQLWLRPWSWRNVTVVEELETHLMHEFRASQVLAMTSARGALQLLLAGLKLQAHDEVILQAFTCVVVPNAIRAAKGKPIYVDVDPQTYTMDMDDLAKKITLRTRVIIVQHTFGIATNMTTVMRLARQHDILVIEDCAHSFSGSWNGQSLGTFGDATIMSFGRDKALSSVFGGIAIARHPQFVTAIDQATLSMPSLFWISQQLIHSILMSLIIGLDGGGRYGRLLLGFAKRLHFISKSVTPNERNGRTATNHNQRMTGALAQLALQQWHKRQRFDEHRRRLGQLYQQRLAGKAFVTPVLSIETDTAWLRYPVRHKQRDDLLKKAGRDEIHFGDWYTAVIAPSGSNETASEYQVGQAPKAEMLARETFNLPTNIRTTIQDAERIVEWLLSQTIT